MNCELTADDVLRAMDTDWLVKVVSREKLTAQQVGGDTTLLGATCLAELKRRSLAFDVAMKAIGIKHSEETAKKIF